MTKTMTQSQNGSASNRNQQNDKKSDSKWKKKNGHNDRIHNNNNNTKPKKHGFQGQLQSGVLKGYVITENTNQWPTQYRNLKKKLPAFCAEKDYDGLDEIVRDLKDWDLDLRVLGARGLEMRLTGPTRGHFWAIEKWMMC